MVYDKSPFKLYFSKKSYLKNCFKCDWVQLKMLTQLNVKICSFFLSVSQKGLHLNNWKWLMRTFVSKDVTWNNYLKFQSSNYLLKMCERYEDKRWVMPFCFESVKCWEFWKRLLARSGYAGYNIIHHCQIDICRAEMWISANQKM